MRCVSRTSLCQTGVLLTIFTCLVLLPHAGFSQTRTVDVRAYWGHATGLDDSPPYAWVGGVSVMEGATGAHTRLGIEVWRANQFGPYGRDSKSRATLLTFVWEYEFEPGQRLRPYMTAGVGLTRYWTRYRIVNVLDPAAVPEFFVDTQGSLNYHVGLGVRWFLTRHVFVAPEARIGFPRLRPTVGVGYAF